MKRRAFLTLIGGAAAAWPLAARAQQAGKGWRIGYVAGVSRSAASGSYAAFVQGMRELGYVEGKEFCHRVALGGGKVRTISRNCGGTHATEGRYLCHRRDGCPAGAAAGNHHDSDRHGLLDRPGWKRARSELGASWRQHHRAGGLV